MPRYYFDIRLDEALIRDAEGTELAGRQEALEFALAEIRELVMTRAGSKLGLASSKIEVCDTDKELLFAVPFPEALRI